MYKIITGLKKKFNETGERRFFCYKKFKWKESVTVKRGDLLHKAHIVQRDTRYIEANLIFVLFFLQLIGLAFLWTNSRGWKVGPEK